MPVTPTCPRCGYDQSGEIARWQGSCPLSGRCSECGLQFAWCDVVLAEKLVCSGFFEHAIGVRQNIAWAWRTLGWCVFPWRFWSHVQMHHRLHVGRLVVWLVALWVSVWWVILGAHAARLILWKASPGSWYPLYASGDGNEVLPAFAGSLGLDKLWTKLGWTDLWTLAWPIAAWGQHANDGFCGFGGPFRGDVAVYSPIAQMRTSGLLLIGASSLAYPSMLLLLSDTRARAKVRFRHVARAIVYGSAWIGVWMSAMMMDELHALAWAFSPSLAGAWRVSGAQWMIEGGVWVVLAWQASWWLHAVRHGFRVERPWTVWIAMTIPTGLSVYAVFAIVQILSLAS